MGLNKGVEILPVCLYLAYYIISIMSLNNTRPGVRKKGIKSGKGVLRIEKNDVVFQFKFPNQLY